jgi:hypothetical protein
MVDPDIASTKETQILFHMAKCHSEGHKKHTGCLE